MRKRKITIVCLTCIALASALFFLIINSYGVTETIKSTAKKDRYLSLKYTYAQDKSTNELTLTVNHFMIYNTTATGSFSCSAPVKLQYGENGKTTAPQWRSYSKTISYSGGGEIGSKGLVNAAGWSTKSATVTQTNGKAVDLKLYGLCDLSGASKGYHELTKIVQVSGYNGGEMTVTGNISWNDDNNRDGKRPESIDFEVIRQPSGIGEGTAYVNNKNLSEGEWSHTGYAYGYGSTYSFVPVYPDVQGYIKNVVGNNVVYTYSPEQMTPTVTVVWNDNNNSAQMRPEAVDAVLTRNLKDVCSMKISEANGWIHTVSPLYKYEDGEQCSFELNAADVDGYKKKITGSSDSRYCITYTYVPGYGVNMGFSI